MPSISIIVPVYNVEIYLSECIDSILKQTFNDFELILVDDGSTDNSSNICDEYALLDSRIKVIHKTNGGLSDARNVGIDHSTGEYLGFIDSDDYIDQEMYRELYNSVIDNNAALAICNAWHVDERKNDLMYRNSDLPIKDEVLTNIEVLNRIYEKNGYMLIPAYVKLYHKSLFANRRFKKGKIHEDEFIAHHIIYECKRIACVAKPMYYYRLRTNSIMTKEFDIRRLDAVEAFNERIEFYNEKKLYELRKTTEAIHASLLLEDFRKLDYKDPNVKKRIRELKKDFNKRILRLCLNRIIGKKRKIEFFLFYIHPELYSHINSSWRKWKALLKNVFGKISK